MTESEEFDQSEEEEEEEDIVIPLRPDATFKDLHDAIELAFVEANKRGADDPDEANDYLWSEIHDWRGDLSERIFDLLCDPQHAEEAAQTGVLDFFEERGETRSDVETFLPIEFVEKVKTTDKKIRVSVPHADKETMSSVGQKIAQEVDGLSFTSGQEGEFLLEVSPDAVGELNYRIASQLQKLLGFGSIDVEVLEKDNTVDQSDFTLDDVWNIPDGERRVVDVDDQKLEAAVFRDRTADGKPVVHVSLFLTDPATKYARKSLVLHEDGHITEDIRGVFPDTDLTEDEPVFRSTNRDIFHQVIRSFLAYHND